MCVHTCLHVCLCPRHEQATATSVTTASHLSCTCSSVWVSVWFSLVLPPTFLTTQPCLQPAQVSLGLLMRAELLGLWGLTLQGMGEWDSAHSQCPRLSGMRQSAFCHERLPFLRWAVLGAPRKWTGPPILLLTPFG